MIFAAVPSLAQAAPATSPEAYAGEALREFGACVARVAPKVGVALLATQPGSRAEAGALRRFNRLDTCIASDVLNRPITQLRGAVAEGLMGAGTGHAPRPIADTPIFRFSDDGVARNKHDLNEAIYGFGQCAVTARPEAVRVLAASASGSATERSSFTSIKPALGPCLASDAAMRLDKPTLRAVLSESLYMLTMTEAAR